MREMPGFSGLASADFEGVFAHSYKRCRPRLFFGGVSHPVFAKWDPVSTPPQSMPVNAAPCGHGCFSQSRLKFFGMWRIRFLCAADEIVQVGPDIGPSADAQPSLQCLLGLLPKW